MWPSEVDFVAAHKLAFQHAAIAKSSNVEIPHELVLVPGWDDDWTWRQITYRETISADRINQQDQSEGQKHRPKLMDPAY